MRKHLVWWALAALAGLLAVAALASVLMGELPTDSLRDAPETNAVALLPRDGLAHVDSWAFAIGDGALDGHAAAVADRLGIFELVVIDAEEATAEEIAALHSRKTLVLAYLSIGTIEPWRSWYAALKPFALDRMSDWDEYYADVSEPGYRRTILGIASGMLDKGFDGLFVDNVDMVESHPSQVGGMRALVSALSAQTRRRGGLLFAQNGDAFATTLTSLLDGWNREDVTFRHDSDASSYVRVPEDDHETALATIESMRDAGVFVTTTDYVSVSGSADESEALGVARGIGALPYVSDIELERIPETPFVRSAQ